MGYELNGEITSKMSAEGYDMAETCGDLAKACDTYVLMVPNAEAVDKILNDPKRGILTHAKEKSLIVDCSTIGPSKAKHFYD